MSRLYGLIFDVDGVIGDTEPANAKASIQVFADMFGVEGVRPEDFEKGLGKGAEEYMRAAARVHGMELGEDEVEAAVQMRQQNFLQALETEPIAAFPGVLELIEAALASEDVKPAIATSGNREMSEAILRSAGVPYERMAYISGSDVRKKKPDPEIFLKAAGRLGIEPARCVVIEDAPGGVEAAKRAGAKCIAVTNSVKAHELAAADMVCGSLTAVDLATIRRLVDAG
jgi:HAD superfamily hydrolase (TIGR01509 family)